MPHSICVSKDFTDNDLNAGKVISVGDANAFRNDLQKKRRGVPPPPCACIRSACIEYVNKVSVVAMQACAGML